MLRVWKFDITPDNTKLVATGNFRLVNGQTRKQIAILDLSQNPVTLTDWSTDFFQQTDPNVADQASIGAAWCIPAFAHYIRGIDISPDGSYFAAVTTGANWLHPSCDSMSRFDLGDYTPNQQPEWVTQTGGDSFHSVLVTGAAIYGGGHQQYVNNPYNPNRCGFCINPYAGGVSRTGFSAHDPRNGMAFTWNPVRQPRGKGVLAMMSTATGFYFGSDTDRINGQTRQKLAFMPLAGGVTQAPENPYTLPGNFYTVGQSGSPDALLRRSFNGSTFGAADRPRHRLERRPRGVRPERPALHGSVERDAHRPHLQRHHGGQRQHDQPVRARERAGTAVHDPRHERPDPRPVDHAPEPDGHGDRQGLRLLHRAGRPAAVRAGFTQQSQILSAVLLVPSTGDGVDWDQVRGMTIASGKLYFALSDGTLNVIDWNGGAYGQGHPTGTATTIGGPSVDGIDWASNAFFVYN